MQKYAAILVLFCLGLISNAQDSTNAIDPQQAYYDSIYKAVLNEKLAEQPSTSTSTSSTTYSSPSPSSPVNKSNYYNPLPTIGIGSGMFSFYGDMFEKHFQNPFISRYGLDLQISQEIFPNVWLNFNALFGKLGANERLDIRNLNFESQIKAGSISGVYNFGHFLPFKRQFSPYFSLGVESFEYLSKTDLFDHNGARYYYWSDYTIRNVPESTANAAHSVILQRDYTYESDIREQNIDGFGKYPERSFAIPIGLGGIIHISDDVSLKLGLTYHMTFTDYIDGITDESVGTRKGNSRNDAFVYTSFSIQYNLSGLVRDKNDTLDPHWFDGVDFLALESEDSDGDGVRDTADKCPGTALGIEVDYYGCPPDDDNDGVPNYKDDEVNSKPGAIVNLNGVELTDSMLLSMMWDTSGMYKHHIVKFHGSASGTTTGPSAMREFTILVGEYSKGIPPDLMTKFLSIPDIGTKVNDTVTYYTAGKYDRYDDAASRRDKLISEGITSAKVVYFKNNKYVIAGPEDETAPSFVSSVIGNSETTTGNTSSTNNSSTESNKPKPVVDIKNPGEGVVFRVQLGAYKKPLSKNITIETGNLVEVKTENGLYKYMTGSFSDFKSAAEYKTNMILKGFKGAFITAYKDGERASLRTGGATFVNKNEVEDIKEKNIPVNTLNKQLIIFKVQVGAYLNEPPKDVQMKFQWLKNLTTEPAEGGLKRYIAGEFNNYDEALKLKDDIVNNYEIQDAFIIALFNGRYITVQEALELIK